MKNQSGLLIKYVSEQIALEEQLGALIDKQVTEIDPQAFPDAVKLLAKTKAVLEQHYLPLNELLDQLEIEVSERRKSFYRENGASLGTVKRDQSPLVSTFLKDDYSALNLITISNSLLHTIALALGSTEVATTALQHLENLAPLVVKIGELMPEVVTRELSTQFSGVDSMSAGLALKNVQYAWKKAG